MARVSGPTGAAGWADYSSGGTNKFIPEVWSGKINYKFYASSCLSKICNTNWEGEIKGYGDTVIIRSGPTIAWSDGTVGEELSYTQPEAAAIELNINKLKRFGIILDSVDKVQSDVKLFSQWTQDAAEQKKIVVEKDVFANIYSSFGNAGATAGEDSNINLGATGSPLALTKSNVLDFIVSLGQIKDENNCPETGRWTVLPPWVCALIKRSDLQDASISGDGSSILRNGRVGVIDRETIYMSNNLTAVTDTTQCYHVLSGHPKGLTYASQVDDVKTGVSEKYDGEWMRGKVLYGYKVNVPSLMCDGYVTRG